MMDKYTINRYKLPIPKNQLQRIDRTSSTAHVGDAIDFVVDEKTPGSYFCTSKACYSDVPYQLSTNKYLAGLCQLRIYDDLT
jgi:hypothetical protein